jgi:anthranilate phosphoribosyltransferase
MQLDDPTCGWAYVDQRHACPSLHQLVDLRSRIVKRPLLTTLEVLLAPVLGQQSTHLVTGYVHKPYAPIYAMLARKAGFASAAIVRGVEGGVIASLNQPSKLLRFTADRDNEEIRLDPALASITSQTRAVPLPDVLSPASAQSEQPDNNDMHRRALATAQAGRLALAGVPGPMCDSLIYGAAVCLLHRGVENSLEGASATVRSVLDSGQPTAHFDAGCH